MSEHDEGRRAFIVGAVGAGAVASATLVNTAYAKTEKAKTPAAKTRQPSRPVPAIVRWRPSTAMAPFSMTSMPRRLRRSPNG